MTAKILGTIDAILDYVFHILKKVVIAAFLLATIAALYFTALVILGYSIVK